MLFLFLRGSKPWIFSSAKHQIVNIFSFLVQKEPETVQKCRWLYFSLVAFMDTEIGISQNPHVLQNISLFDCSQTLGNAKTATTTKLKTNKHSQLLYCIQASSRQDLAWGHRRMMSVLSQHGGLDWDVNKTCSKPGEGALLSLPSADGISLLGLSGGAIHFLCT